MTDFFVFSVSVLSRMWTRGDEKCQFVQKDIFSFVHWLHLTTRSSLHNLCTILRLYFYPTVSTCNNFMLRLCFSLRFSQLVHQQRVAAAVCRTRGSSWVSVRADGAAGRVCDWRVVPVVGLPLHTLLLGSFSRSRFGGQHWWVQRVYCEMRESLEIHSSNAAPCWSTVHL